MIPCRTTEMLLRTPQPGSIHRPLPTRSPAGHCRPAATRGAPPLRIVVVNREAILLTFVWQLTAFFQRVSPTRLPAWLCWSYADLARTSRVAAATRAVRTADWVVFCQATSKPLPTHVRRWADSWPHRRSAPGPAIGFFSLTTTGFDAEVKTQAYLRDLARSVGRCFIAVRDFLWSPPECHRS